MANLMPLPKMRFFSAAGVPLAGGKLYSYAAGTTTPLATYTDQGGLTTNANPVILDANGEASIWLSGSAYKFVLKDSNDITQWTVDSVSRISASEITVDKLADGILSADVTGRAKMADGYVNAAKIEANAVTTVKIPDNAITAAKILDGVISRAKLAAGAVASVNVTASKTANYTATTSDDIIPCDATSAAFTVTLPTAVGNSGVLFHILNTGSTLNAVTISGTGLSTTLNTPGEAAKVYCNGSAWVLLERTGVRTTAVAYTPSFTAYGSPVSSVSMKSWREGRFLCIQGSWTNGTVAASGNAFTIGFNGTNTPSGLSMDTSGLGSVNIPVGFVGTTSSGGWHAWVMYKNHATELAIGQNLNGGNTSLQVANGSDTGNGWQLSTSVIRVQIAGWND